MGVTPAAPRVGFGSRILLFLSLCFITFTTFAAIVVSSPTPPNDKRLGSHCKDHDCIGYDVVIYGSTPAAIAAAIQTKRMKKTVAIVTPDEHLGGLTASGLGWTDSKNGESIGGIAREFYQEIYNYYKDDSKWKLETRQQYINKMKDSPAQPGPVIEDDKGVQWTFEPHVAESIFERWIKDADVPVYRSQRLNRNAAGVIKFGGEILLITTLEGRFLLGSMFIDASYEGDLMATAKVPYRIGRESSEEFGESFAGIRVSTANDYAGVDPYVVEGEPSSGLISGVQRVLGDDNIDGHADNNRLQSYNYRLPLTKHKDQAIKFYKPAGYNETDYEILFRYLEAGVYDGQLFTTQLMPNGKTDTNAAGRVSTDLMGGNYDQHSNYVEDDYEQREVIAKRHKEWAEGFFWTLANHPRVPQKYRDYVSKFGYAANEFESNDNWPYSIYIRESRRMKSKVTLTQMDVESPKQFSRDNSVGLGCYNLDVHQVERVVKDDQIFDEGLVHEWQLTPYPIPFDAIIPNSRDAINLLNPVTMSSTHIAFASLRMEPTFMILGQSAATAAVMAINDHVKVQDVNRQKLFARLEKDGQYLSWPNRLASGA